MTGLPQWTDIQHAMELSLPRSISPRFREVINYIGGMRVTKLSWPAPSLVVSRSWRTANDARAQQGKPAAEHLAQL